jgi:hypothetical protein
MSNGDEVETYHGEIGREATAGTQTRSTRVNLTTRKSVGEPANQNEGAGGICIIVPLRNFTNCVYWGGTGVALGPQR